MNKTKIALSVCYMMIMIWYSCGLWKAMSRSQNYIRCNDWTATKKYIISNELRHIGNRIYVNWLSIEDAHGRFCKKILLLFLRFLYTLQNKPAHAKQSKQATEQTANIAHIFDMLDENSWPTTTTNQRDTIILIYWKNFSILARLCWVRIRNNSNIIV